MRSRGNVAFRPIVLRLVGELKGDVRGEGELSYYEMLKRIPILLALLGAGCSYVPMLGLSPHRVDIQQGNYITQDMVAKLEPGMTKNQVRFALGTPLIADPFHADRWDYVFVQQKQGRVTQQRRVVVVFENDKLVRLEGDVAPSRDIAQEAPK